MADHSIQVWLSFVVLGVATAGNGLLPALPPAANPQLVGFGVLLLFASGIGSFITSPTIVTELQSVEQRAQAALGRGDAE